MHDHPPCLPLPTTSPPHSAVVLLLSKAFISKKYPMEELHLLLEWQRQGSPAKLLPVFYDVTHKDLCAKILELKAAAWITAEERLLRKQWVDDLEGLLGITGIQKDQVGCRV
jgi:hypothetical protein